MSPSSLPLPPHVDLQHTGQVWRVPYEEVATSAAEWARRHEILPAASDRVRTLLIPVDMQNTFCIPGFELYVGGRSGTGAVDDVRRLCTFIYRNLAHLTAIAPTLDTHQVIQIFHSVFWLDSAGAHPDPYTLISVEDVQSGRWRPNPTVSAVLGMDSQELDAYVRHYVATLRTGGRYELTIWPYHALLGGIGHALVSALEEAVVFHGLTRSAQPLYQTKGDNPLTENYSALRPEVRRGPREERVVGPQTDLTRLVMEYDAVIIAGEAKSHCVASTIADLLADLQDRDPALASKVYLLEDCTSPVVIPGVLDYTDAADDAFRGFARAGMHIVRSTDPLETWPDFPRS